MARSESDRDSNNKLFCEPWNGSRTPAGSTRTFKRDFKAQANALFLHEDDHSIWQAMTDVDQGRQGANADPMPAVGQNGHVNAVRRRRRRQAKAFERVYAHIDDERLREMLSDLPDDDRRGVNAWNLVLRECDEGTSDLEILATKSEFESATIESTVGYSEDTIIKFSRVLHSLNARLPDAHKYSETHLSVKMLANINHPDALALEAVTELRQPEGSRRFEHVVVVATTPRKPHDAMRNDTPLRFCNCLTYRYLY